MDSPSSEPEKLLETAVELLRDAQFKLCRKHALAARDHDPHNPIPDRILAIADVMRADWRNPNDWYSVLQVTRPDYGNLGVARSQFEKLSALLNPEQNRLPYSAVALIQVQTAWDILNNPGKVPPVRNQSPPFWYDKSNDESSDDDDDDDEDLREKKIIEVVEISSDDDDDDDDVMVVVKNVGAGKAPVKIRKRMGNEDGESGGLLEFDQSEDDDLFVGNAGGA